MVSGEEGLQRIAVGESLYVESQRRRMLIHTKGQAIRIYETMKNMEQKLSMYLQSQAIWR